MKTQLRDKSMKAQLFSLILTYCAHADSISSGEVDLTTLTMTQTKLICAKSSSKILLP